MATFVSDIRTEDCWGQSIDLALSIRGREALRAVGLEEVVVDHHGIAMRGRMIHNKNGSLKEILYDGVNQNVSDFTIFRFFFFSFLIPKENRVKNTKCIRSFFATFILIFTFLQCIYSVTRRYLNIVLLNGE